MYQPVPAPGINLPMGIEEADPVTDLDVAHAAGDDDHHLEEEDEKEEEEEEEDGEEEE